MDDSRLRIDCQFRLAPILGGDCLENAAPRCDLDIREALRRQLVPDLLLGYWATAGDQPIPRWITRGIDRRGASGDGNGDDRKGYLSHRPILDSLLATSVRHVRRQHRGIVLRLV